MVLVVLDYEWGNVEIIKNIPEEIDNLEQFVSENLGYKRSEVSYILLDDDYRTITYTYDIETNTMSYNNENFIDNGSKN